MTWYPGKREAENEREKYRDKIRFRLIIEHENYTHEEDVYLKSKYHVKDFIAVILMNGYVMDCS
ncbi:MAG: hypothetical protein KAS39_04340, partial [Actinomycetia bacterium]|nr:hypothetical protein [Actinomycetes bacterium]